MGKFLGEVLCRIFAKRDQVAKWYNEQLDGLELLETPTIVPSTTRMSWFVYVVRIRRPAVRSAVMRRLCEVGIPSRPYYTPIHLQPFTGKDSDIQLGCFLPRNTSEV